IIKLLEEKTSGWYSPSPGIVYPTLTYLEEAGHVTAQAEGSKKLYTITDDGRAYLDQNRDFVDAVLERLTAIGSKITRMRRRFGRDDEDEERRGSRLPPLVRAALENARQGLGERLENDADAEAQLGGIPARAAQELKKVCAGASRPLSAIFGIIVRTQTGAISHPGAGPHDSSAQLLSPMSIGVAPSLGVTGQTLQR